MQLLSFCLFALHLNVFCLGSDDIIHNLSPSTYSKSYGSLEITINSSEPNLPKFTPKEFPVVDTLLTILDDNHNGKMYKGTLVIVNNLARNMFSIEHNACTPVINSYSTPWIAIVYDTNECSYHKQIDNALHGTNASAMILIADSIKLETLALVPSQNKIGLLFQSREWKNLTRMFNFSYPTAMIIQMPAESNPIFNSTSILFASISFVLLLLIGLGWLMFFYFQRFRTLYDKGILTQRLSHAAKKALCKIPVKTLRAGDKEVSGENEQCAVCIETYIPGDIVRILPCRHFFHKFCIDPWLLEKRSCPMCKVDIVKACRVPLATYSPKEGCTIYRSNRIPLFEEMTRSPSLESRNIYQQHRITGANLAPCPNCRHNAEAASCHATENLRPAPRVRGQAGFQSYYHRRSHRVLSSRRVWPNILPGAARRSDMLIALTSCCCGSSVNGQSSSSNSQSSINRNLSADSFPQPHRMANSHVMKATSQRGCPTCTLADSEQKQLYHRHQVTAECQCGHVTELNTPDEEDAGSSSLGETPGAIIVTVEPPEVQYHLDPSPSGDSQVDTSHNCHRHHRVKVQLERRHSSSSCFSDKTSMKANLGDSIEENDGWREECCSFDESSSLNNVETSEHGADVNIALLTEDGCIVSKV